MLPKLKINHIYLVLGLAVLFLILVFFVEWIRNNVFYSFIVLLVIYLLIYWRTADRFEKYDLFLILFILLSFIISRLLFREVDQPTLTLRIASILAFTLLNVVLLIGPWSRFSDRVLKIYHYRRHIGITIFLLAALHVSIIFPLYFTFSIESAFSSIFVFYGFTGLFLLLWLALTSWDYIQKKFKALWWKLIHAVLLAIYVGFAYYFYTIQKFFEDPTLKYHLWVIGLFILIWIIVAPYSIIRKIMRTYVFGWKQLHVLIYIVYFSLVLHVLLGALTTANLFIKVVFYTSIVFVLGSHLVGWIIKYKEDKEINSKMEAVHKLLPEQGKTFIGIAKVNEFEEGKGKKFYVNKKPIAVFKNNGIFFAVSNVCCHQKGPIYKGKINYGTVECPWHYWVYNLKDGKFLGKEKLCLPVYETKVKDNVLYVNPEPVKK